MNLAIGTLLISNVCFLVWTRQLAEKEEEEKKTCLNERAVQIKSSLHRKAIICEMDEPCVLDSNHCPSDPIPVWLKQSVNKSNEPIDFVEEDEHFFLTKSTRDLVITSPRLSDAGFYWQTIYNKTVIAEFHLTVLTSKQLLRRPVYESIGTKPNSQLDQLEQTVRIDQSDLQIRTEWQEWSECFCTHDSNHTGLNSRGYRLRFGDCEVKLAKRVKQTSKTSFIKDVERLFGRFMSIPCLSQLIPAKFKQIFAANILYYVMYESCEPSASCQVRSNQNRSQFTKEKPSTDEQIEEKIKQVQYKHLVEPAESQLIMSDTNQELVLGCNWKRNIYDFYSSKEDLVSWYFVDEESFLNNEQNITDLDNWLMENTEINRTLDQVKAGRLFVDADHQLNIKKTSKSHSGIYSCHLNNLTRLIYVLRVSQQVPYNIIIYSTYFGIYLLLFTLIAINLRTMINAVNNRTRTQLVSSFNLKS